MFICNCQALQAVNRLHNLKPGNFVPKLANISLPCKKTAAELAGELNIEGSCNNSCVKHIPACNMSLIIVRDT